MENIKTYNQYLSLISREFSALNDKPEETPDSTLKALWFKSHGSLKSAQLAELSADSDLPTLDADQHKTLDALIKRRLEGEPLAHITHRQQFMGIELLAGPDALVPRKETEILGNAVVELLNSMVSNEKQDFLVIDVCTGAGNLAISYATHVPESRIYAADLSNDAVELAKKNVEFCGLQGRVEVQQGDLLEPYDNKKFHSKVDVLSCNPPYISSAKVGDMEDEISSYEPRLAFDGGAFGIKIVQKLIKEAPKYIREGGWLAFEIGLGQGPALIKRLQKNVNFSQIVSKNDEHGEIRVILAKINRREK